ncbi:MAG: head GIN domain-containing protein [Burkholderiales bacterium]
MRSLALTLAALVSASAWLFAAPAVHADEGAARLQHVGWSSVTGSGKLQNETRNVAGFQGISTAGSIRLVLRQGTREGVELRSDDNILPLIETRVVDRGGVPTLVIGTKSGASYASRNPVVATIDLITLRALTVAGSGDVVSEALKSPSLRLVAAGSSSIKLRQLAVDELSAKVAGSGDLELTGRAGILALVVAGSGDANARGLEADEASVAVAGSGDASVNARKSLSISVAGSGSVAYTGSANVKTAIAGSGSVKKL